MTLEIADDLRNALLRLTGTFWAMERTALEEGRSEETRDMLRPIWRSIPHLHAGMAPDNDICRRCGYDLRHALHATAYAARASIASGEKDNG